MCRLMLIVVGTMVPTLCGCENSQRVRALVTHVDGGEATLAVGATIWTPSTTITIKDGASVYFMHRDTPHQLIDAMNENETDPPAPTAPPAGDPDPDLSPDEDPPS